MSHRTLRGLLWLSLLLFTSCVDFDGQTCSYRYDAASDELRILQVYERIFAEGEDGKITAKEQTQLASLLEDQHTYFFSNWILEYSRPGFAARVTELDGQISGEEAENIDVLKAERDLLSALLKGVKVANGDFYQNQKKELCGYQMVTVSNVSRLIDTANRYANLAALSAEHGKWTGQVHEFAEAGGKWIALDGNKLTIRYFQPPEDYEQSRKERAKLMANGRPAFDGVVSYKEPFVEMTFGEKDGTRTDFQVDNRSEGKYNTLVLDQIRGRQEIVGMLNVARVRDNFLSGEKVESSRD